MSLPPDPKDKGTPPSGSGPLLSHPWSCCGQPRRRDAQNPEPRVQCAELAFPGPDPHLPPQAEGQALTLSFQCCLQCPPWYFSTFYLTLQYILVFLKKRMGGWVRHRDRKGGRKGGKMKGRFTCRLPCAGPMLHLLEFKLHNPPGDGVVGPISQMRTLRFRETR